jgi:hypothetical protein
LITFPTDIHANHLIVKLPLGLQELLEVQKILTPTQTAKFILWITQNPACMHMLNQLWTVVHEKPALTGTGEGEEGGVGNGNGNGDSDGDAMAVSEGSSAQSS